MGILYFIMVFKNGFPIFCRIGWICEYWGIVRVFVIFKEKLFKASVVFRFDMSTIFFRFIWSLLIDLLENKDFTAFSSNVNEGIKAVLLFKRKDFTRTKSTKSTKSIKSIKSKKRIKSTKRQTNDFLLLRCFYAHENAVFFVLHTKKHKKHIKNIKTQISE